VVDWKEVERVSIRFPSPAPVFRDGDLPTGRRLRLERDLAELHGFGTGVQLVVEAGRAVTWISNPMSGLSTFAVKNWMSLF
jgi:hypothetical protein